MKHLIYILIICALLTVKPHILESEPSYAIYTGKASWYADFSPGICANTANMEKFDHSKMTCAMWNVPFNTMVEVTNLCNGKKIILRVNDRGPAKRLFEHGRIIDMTKAAFEFIDDLNKGLIEVRVRILR